MRLGKFVEMWNGTMPQLDKLGSEYADCIYYPTVIESLTQTFCVSPPRKLSLSQIYKPLSFNILTQNGVHSQPAVNGKGRWALHYGQQAEASLLWLLYEYGVEIDDFQKEVDYRGIKGHIDFYYPKYDAVIDVKTLNGYYFQSFCENPNDDRGYISQILTYKKALGCSEAYILALDKMFGGLALIKIEEREVYSKDGWECTGQDCLDRVDKSLDILLENPPVSDCWEKYIPNFAYNVKDRKTKQIPECVRYDTRSWCFWDYDQKSRKIKRCYDSEEIRKMVEALYEKYNGTN